MLATKYCPLAIAAAFLAISPAALAQNVSLTDKQFQNRGASEFVGTIESVNITSSNQYTETGTVAVQVSEVLSGTIAAPAITFPFQRALVTSDYLSNWDLIVPLGTSLTTAVGDQLVVFVTESNGVYSAFPALNSVQLASQGLLVGKITSLVAHDFDQDLQIEFQVSETVYGWVKGSTITLRLPSLFPQPGISPLRDGSAAAMLKSFGGNGSASALKSRLLQENDAGDVSPQLVLGFANGEITAAQPASSQFLRTLQALDSE